MIGMALVFAFALAWLFVFVREMIATQIEWERQQLADMDRQRAALNRLEARRAAVLDQGPMALYMATGAVPTGRTAEILALAQESHDRRRGR